MSHTGQRIDYNTLNRLTYTGYPDPRPKKISVLDLENQIISRGGILDGHELIGEFGGNGTTVLVGLSSVPQLDVTNILNDNEKGIIIGYTPNSPYFQLFTNDGLGAKVTANLDNGRFKDNNNHEFDIKLESGNKLSIRFDGAVNTITTKIPSINDTLYIVNYSVY